MTPQQIFEEQIAGRLADPAQQASAKELDAVYQFHVTGDNGGDWVVDLQNCPLSLVLLRSVFHWFSDCVFSTVCIFFSLFCFLGLQVAGGGRGIHCSLREKCNHRLP